MPGERQVLSLLRRGCPSAVLSSPVHGFLILLLFLASTVAQTSSPPFLNLRSPLSSYRGTAPDRGTNASPKVIWFGPTNELFWSASCAFSNAGSSVSLVACWTADPWKSGAALLTRMVIQHKPLAILGSVDSASTHLAEQVAAKTQTPLVSPIATDPSLTLAGVPWMFSCAPSDVAIAKAIVGHLDAARHPAAMFSGTDHESRMTAREILKEFSRRGQVPSFKFEFEPGASRVSTQLRAVQEASPRSIILVASAEDSARLLPQLRRVAPVIAGPTVARRACLILAGSAVDGVEYPELTSPPPDHPFATGFKLNHGYAPDYTAWLTYDAASLLAAALKSCNYSASGLHLALASLSPYFGTAGEIRFDATGQNTRQDLRIRVMSNTTRR